MAIYSTMGIADVAEVSLVVCAAHGVNPTLDDLTRCLDDCGQTPRPICLVYCFDVSLDAAGRKKIADLVNVLKMRVAVLVSSGLARGIVTALNWLTGNTAYRAFAMHETDQALEWLGVPRARWAEITREAERMKRKMLEGRGSSVLSP